MSTTNPVLQNHGNDIRGRFKELLPGESEEALTNCENMLNDCKDRQEYDEQTGNRTLNNRLKLEFGRFLHWGSENELFTDRVSKPENCLDTLLQSRDRDYNYIRKKLWALLVVLGNCT